MALRCNVAHKRKKFFKKKKGVIQDNNVGTEATTSNGMTGVLRQDVPSACTSCCIIKHAVICEAVPTTGCRSALCLATFPFTTSRVVTIRKETIVVPETREEGRCSKEAKNKSSTEIMSNNYSVLCAKHVTKFERANGRIVYI